MTYDNLLPHTSADANPGTLPDLDSTRQARTRADVDCLFQHAIVIHTASGIEYAAKSDTCTGVYHRPGKNDRSHRDICITTDNRMWMNNRNNRCICIRQALQKAMACSIIPDCHYNTLILEKVLE